MGKSPNGRLALHEGLLFCCFGGFGGGLRSDCLMLVVGLGDKVGLERLCHGWLDVGCTEGWILCSVYDGFGELLGRRGVPRTTPMPRGPGRSTRSGMDLVLRYTGAVNLAYLDRKAHLQSLSMLG
jgi:hypothetical protein